MWQVMIRFSGVLLVMALSACGLRTGALPEPAQNHIGFENGSNEAVRVYLVGAGQDWLIGRVGPGRDEQLRIPLDFPTSSGGTVSLAVVPAGAPDFLGAGAIQVPSAIHSGPYLIADLLRTRWSLRGQLLFAHPLGARDR